MYIKLKVMAALGVALVASGCTKDEPPNGDPNLAGPEARSAVAKIHEMENGLKTINDCVAHFPIVNEMLASIGKVMETPERVAVLDYMIERFFPIDLSRLKYATQSRAILAHYAGISHYESLMSNMERWFLDDKRKMTEAAWIGLKEKIEGYLGRPIRTKAQLRDDFVKRRRIEFTEKEDDYAVPWE